MTDTDQTFNIRAWRRYTLFLVPLPLFLQSCNPTDAKISSDLLQSLLRQEGWTGWLVCFLLILAVWQGYRLLKAGFRLLWWSIKTAQPLLIRLRLISLAVVAVLGTLLWGMRDGLIDVIQEFEQRYISPVWVGEVESLTEEHQTAIYEAELSKRIDPYELEVVKRRTREMAVKIRSTPLAIYECAYLECALNPFTVRKDQVAAGWIQFTRAGLAGMRYNGQRISFDQVLYACKQRDIKLMMDLTEIYLVNQFEAAGQKPLNNTIDLYLALFAPVHIGAPSDKVVYQGANNPAYFLNKGLDGWFVVNGSDGKKQILRKSSACDNAITIWEMYLALEAKKIRLMKSGRK